MHPYAKFHVCSAYAFWDMFQGVPNFIRVTWPRPRPFSKILFVRFGEIVHVHQCAKFEVSSFTRFSPTFGDMFEGVPNFIRVTWPRPHPFSEILFVDFREIVYMHPCAKFQVSSFTGFGDMFEGVPNFIGDTWPRPRPFSEFLFVHFGEIVHAHQFAKFEVSSFTHFGDMFEGVPNFIGVTWPRPRPFSEFLFVHFGEIVHMRQHVDKACGQLYSFWRYVWGCAKFYKRHVT